MLGTQAVLGKGNYSFYPVCQGGLSYSWAPWWGGGGGEAPPPFPCLLGGERQEFPLPLGSSRASWDTAVTGAWAGRRKSPRRRGLPPVLAQRPLLLSVSWQVKPVVSGFLREKQLPYNEDSYLARFRLFLNRYEEFMVQTPPITELVGLQ